MRKISVSGYGCQERLGVSRTFELFHEADLGAIDFSLYSGRARGLLYIEGEGSLEERCGRIRALAEKYDIEIGQTHAPFGYREGDGSTLESVSAVYNEAIRATKLLGSRLVVLHPINFQKCKGGYHREECRELNLELYRSLVPTLRETGVTALIENMFLTEWIDETFFRHYGTPFSTAEDLASAKDALGDEFGVCLDTGHALITGEDVPLMAETLGDRLLALHLHDNTGTRDDHLPPYCGKVPFEALMRALKKIGYRGNINFETDLDKVPEEHLPALLRYISGVGVAFCEMLDGDRV